MQLTLSGGGLATLSASKIGLTKQAGSATLCSNTGTWTASFTVSSPSPLYVSEGTAHAGSGTSLCGVEVSPCPAASRYAEGQSLEATAPNLEITGPAGQFVTLNCSSPKLTGQVGASAGGGVQASLSSPKMGCSGSGVTCTASFSFPNGGTFTIGAAPDGSLSLVAPSFETACGYQGSIVCRYSSSEASLPLHGGSPATLAAAATPFVKQAGSNSACGNTATVTASFTVNTPSPLYLEFAA